ncbi:hypothetical protein [Cesiribacter sp. SM1]|uniref:hypothetical protein n=1 Tax=Cesiribacter sp. SM1 TaxID=2861196 RepID=UPI001CD4668C|nr:hypothetical protein [Cesiribacter sp. SM1]
MIEVNRDLADAVVLVLTLVSALLYAVWLSRQPGYSSRKGVTFFLLFLALYPLLNMVAHLIAVGIFSYIRVQAGVFRYDIKFYTLVQFGLLLILINAYLLNRIRQICCGNWLVYRQIIVASLLQVAIVLPLFPFNPISLLPVTTSVLLVGRLALARRGRAVTEAVADLQRVENTTVAA